MTQMLQNATKSRNSDFNIFKHQLACFVEILDSSILADIEDRFAKDREPDCQFMFFLKYIAILENWKNSF